MLKKETKPLILLLTDKYFLCKTEAKKEQTMKKFLCICLIFVLILTACNKNTEIPEETVIMPEETLSPEPIKTEELEQNVMIVDKISEQLTRIILTGDPEKGFPKVLLDSLQAACDERGIELELCTRQGDEEAQYIYLGKRIPEESRSQAAVVCMNYGSEDCQALAELCRENKTYLISIESDVGEPAYYFSKNNSLSAMKNGLYIGRWVDAHWNGKLDKFIRLISADETPIMLSQTENAFSLFVSVLPEYAMKKPDIYCEFVADPDEEVMRQAFRDFLLQGENRKNAWVSGSDGLMASLVEEIEILGKEKENVCVSVDCSEAFLEQLIRKGEDSCWVASLYFDPERYSEYLVKLAEELVKKDGQMPYMNSFEPEVCDLSTVSELFPEKFME